MTGTYDWNPMPHKVDIKCPSCGEHSVFEFAEVVKIALRKNVSFFSSKVTSLSIVYLKTHAAIIGMVRFIMPIYMVVPPQQLEIYPRATLSKIGITPSI